MITNNTPELAHDGSKLEHFLKDSQVLLASLAVLAALLAFANNLKPTWIGETMSFFLVGGLILIWLEIWSKLPPKMHWRLFLFRYVLLWGVALVVFYWIYEYRLFWDIFLFVPTTIVVMALIASNVLPVVRSFRVTHTIFGIGEAQKNYWQKLIRGLFIIGWFFVSFYIGVYISIGTNLFMDLLTHTRP